NTGSFTPDERQDATTPEQDSVPAKPAEPTEAAEEPQTTGGMKIVGKIDSSNLRRGGKAQKAPKEEKAKPVDEKTSPEEAAPTSADAIPADQPEKKEVVAENKKEEPPVAAAPQQPAPKVVPQQQTEKTEPKEDTRPPQREVIRARAQRLTGPNVVGRIDLPVHQPKEKPVASSSSAGVSPHDQKRKRKRKDKPTQRPGTHT